MDFAFLPPEINSARMYTGPGSASMLAAASSWNSLAAELGTSADTVEAVLSGLNLHWQGPAATAMAATGERYVEWMRSTAQLATQSAVHAMAAAAAYERAHAMTVPPVAVTANRVEVAWLVATNLVGQNTASIAAAEAQYADFWAQDAVAMSGYAVTSGEAIQLPPFASPAGTVSESGLAAQQTAVARAAQAAADAVANGAASDPVSQLLETAGQTLQSLATNPASIIPDDLTALDAIATVGTTINSTYYVEAFAAGVIGAENNLGVLPKVGAQAAAEIVPAAPAAPTLISLAGGGGLGTVAAHLGGSGTIGQLAVPASWAAPSTTRITALTPAGFTTIGGTEEAAAAGYPGYPGMPGASRGSGVGSPPRYGLKPTVMPRPPAAG